METRLRDYGYALEKEAPRFHYYEKRVGSKYRRIAEPNDAMRELHSALCLYLSDTWHDLVWEKSSNLNATGGLPKGALDKHPTVANVLPHRGNTHFYLLDIVDAYANIPMERLASLLCETDNDLGYEDTFDFLLRYCAHVKGGLAFGGPASPLLFNIYCEVAIDQPLRALCDKQTAYTRYLDDLTLSQETRFPKTFRKKVRRVIESAGFAVNDTKTQQLTLTPTNPIVITGLALYSSGMISVSSRVFNEIAMLISTPFGQHDKKTQNHLIGLIGYLRLIAPYVEKIGRMKSLLDECNRIVPVRSPYKKNTKIHKIKERTPILEVIGKYVSLRNKGRNWFGVCPFHKGFRPSFSVVPQSNGGFYHCFGCDARGDVIDFVSEYERISPQEAMELLVERYAPFLEDKNKRRVS